MTKGPLTPFEAFTLNNIWHVQNHYPVDELSSIYMAEQLTAEDLGLV